MDMECYVKNICLSSSLRNSDFSNSERIFYIPWGHSKNSVWRKIHLVNELQQWARTITELEMCCNQKWEPRDDIKWTQWSRFRRYTLSLHIQDRIWGWDHVTSFTLAKYLKIEINGLRIQPLLWWYFESLDVPWVDFEDWGLFQRSKSKITYYLPTTVTWISLNVSYSIYTWTLPMNSKIKSLLSCFYHIVITTESNTNITLTL